jgi:hypothetical protein
MHLSQGDIIDSGDARHTNVDDPGVEQVAAEEHGIRVSMEYRLRRSRLDEDGACGTSDKAPHSVDGKDELAPLSSHE